MANKRMFNITIIDSDLFLEMPLTTQALYFHLGMRADDEGFINNPKKILREVGCSEDDLKLLICKGYVIAFRSGIIVITHWNMHNTIQKDRFKSTIYAEERALLSLDDNRQYALVSELDTNCIQTVSKLETQIRLDKIRLDKDRLEYNLSENTEADITEVKPSPPRKRDNIDYQEIADMFNDICTDLPKVRDIGKKRKTAIKARYEYISKNGGFKAFFERVQASDFLCGRNAPEWKGCGFDWILKPDNAVKIIEGNYDNRGGKNKGKGDKPDYYDVTQYKNMEVV